MKSATISFSGGYPFRSIPNGSTVSYENGGIIVTLNNPYGWYKYSNPTWYIDADVPSTAPEYSHWHRLEIASQSGSGYIFTKLSVPIRVTSTELSSGTLYVTGESNGTQVVSYETEVYSGE